jgi:hypothetical protein
MPGCLVNATQLAEVQKEMRLEPQNQDQSGQSEFQQHLTSEQVAKILQVSTDTVYLPF